VQRKLELDFDDLGERDVKNIPDPVHAYRLRERATEAPTQPARTNSRIAIAAGVLAVIAVALAAAIYWPTSSDVPTGPPLTSIAVLPFDDMSPGGDQKWLAGGMAEELIESLSRIRQLRVIARTSSEIAKASGADLAMIGERLRVGSIVEGSVRRSGDQLRVTAQLIRVADESHLWSARYDRGLDDVFAIQREIAREIAEAIRRQLGIEDKSPWLSELRYLPDNVEAYEHMRKGLELQFSTYSNEELRTAEDHYLAALRIEPNWGVVHALLAWNHWSLWVGGHDPSDQRVASARAAANRALELEESAGAPDQLLALMSVVGGDYRSAEERLERALTVAPDAPGLRAGYSQVLAETGRVDEALVHARRAVDLDPLFAGRHVNLGTIYLYAHDYDATIAAYEQALDLNPNELYVAGLLGYAYHQKGMDEDAHQAAFREPTVANPDLHAALRRGFAKGGWAEQNRALMAEIASQTGRTCSLNPAVGSQLYAWAGDADRAFQCVNETLDTRGNIQLLLGGLPTWDPYRDDPRFQEVLRRVGLAD
jgi:TolB-like protein